MKPERWHSVLVLAAIAGIWVTESGVRCGDRRLDGMTAGAPPWLMVVLGVGSALLLLALVMYPLLVRRGG